VLAMRSSELASLGEVISLFASIEFSEADDRRAEIVVKFLQFAIQKPQFLTAEVAASVLNAVWTVAADRSGMPAVPVRTNDDGDIVYDPDILRNLRTRDLPALINEISDLAGAGEWRRTWTVCCDAFGLECITPDGQLG